MWLGWDIKAFNPRNFIDNFYFVFVLYTDFGLTGPYLGQVIAVLNRECSGIPIVNLCADAPKFNPYAAAYLLASLVNEFPTDSIFLGIVDPGVGTSRQAVAVNADGRWYLGPDNGLFEIVSRRAQCVQWWQITWRPQRLSASFHGRDLFAPVATQIARGLPVPGKHYYWQPNLTWTDDLFQIIYQDHYGNCITGIRFSQLSTDMILTVGIHQFYYARTFGEVSSGQSFWYENANGLVEIAVNCGSAAVMLGLKVGDKIQLIAKS